MQEGRKEGRKERRNTVLPKFERRAAGRLQEVHELYQFKSSCQKQKHPIVYPAGDSKGGSLERDCKEERKLTNKEKKRNQNRQMKNLEIQGGKRVEVLIPPT